MISKVLVPGVLPDQTLKCELYDSCLFSHPRLHLLINRFYSNFYNLYEYISVQCQGLSCNKLLKDLITVHIELSGDGVCH